AHRWRRLLQHRFAIKSKPGKTLQPLRNEGEPRCGRPLAGRHHDVEAGERGGQADIAIADSLPEVVRNGGRLRQRRNEDGAVVDGMEMMAALDHVADALAAGMEGGTPPPGAARIEKRAHLDLDILKGERSRDERA